VALRYFFFIFFTGFWNGGERGWDLHQRRNKTISIGNCAPRMNCESADQERVIPILYGKQLVKILRRKKGKTGLSQMHDKSYVLTYKHQGKGLDRSEGVRKPQGKFGAQNADSLQKSIKGTLTLG